MVHTHAPIEICMVAGHVWAEKTDSLGGKWKECARCGALATTNLSKRLYGSIQ